MEMRNLSNNTPPAPSPVVLGGQLSFVEGFGIVVAVLLALMVVGFVFKQVSPKLFSGGANGSQPTDNSAGYDMTSVASPATKNSAAAAAPAPTAFFMELDAPLSVLLSTGAVGTDSAQGDAGSNSGGSGHSEGAGSHPTDDSAGYDMTFVESDTPLPSALLPAVAVDTDSTQGDAGSSGSSAGESNTGSGSDRSEASGDGDWIAVEVAPNANAGDELDAAPTAPDTTDGAQGAAGQDITDADSAKTVEELPVAAVANPKRRPSRLKSIIGLKIIPKLKGTRLITETIDFKRNSAILIPKALDTLKGVFEWLSTRDPELCLVIEAHCFPLGKDGNLRKELVLTYSRKEAVIEELERLGVARHRMYGVGHGSRMPPDDPDASVMRVEIAVLNPAQFSAKKSKLLVQALADGTDGECESGRSAELAERFRRRSHVRYETPRQVEPYIQSPDAGATEELSEKMRRRSHVRYETPRNVEPFVLPPDERASSELKPRLAERRASVNDSQQR
jgi:outer membrane protein OmpA-like peptidoglycan-associated protein